MPHRMPAARRYEGIDVLRGLAAVWVLLSHYFPYWDRYLAPAPILVPNDWGVYGVQLFFVISGFVIFTTLEKCRTVGDFIFLRISRLYPVYWGTLVAVALIGVVAFDHTLWLGGLVVNATMLQDYLGYPRFDNVFWSLTVELTFYALTAITFFFRVHTRPLSSVALWLLAACAWGLWSEARSPDERDALSLALALDYSPYFAMGIAFHQVRQSGWTTAVIATFALALLAEGLIAGLEGVVTGSTCAILFSLGLSGRLTFITGRVSLWLGHISFALYLVHRNLGYELLGALHANGIGPVTGVLITTAAALLAASLLTYGIEKPALRGLRKRHDAWRQRRDGSA